MAKIELVIKIPKYYLTHPKDYTCLAECVRRGTPLLTVQADMLDKIRAEIEQDAFKDVNGSKYIFVNRVNQIIDKYKAEE